MHASDFVEDLRHVIRQLKPTPVKVTPKKSVFIWKGLSTAKIKVFLRKDLIRQPLQPHYSGPFDVIRRFEKSCVIDKDKKGDAISIIRLN